MKKKKELKSILTNIFTIGGIGFLVVYAIVVENYRILYALGMMAILIAILFLVLHFFVLKNKLFEMKLKKYYDLLKTQSKLTVYEECYKLAFVQKLDDEIKAIIKDAKISDINNLGVDAVDTDKIIIRYGYKGFDASIMIKADETMYVIDSPTKYDGLSSNKEFEQKRMVDFACDNYTEKEEYLAQVCDLIAKTKEEINTFSNVNIVDDVFNGRLKDKLHDYLKFLKNEGIINAVLGLPLALFMVFGTVMAFLDTEYKNENLIGFILCLILCPLFAVFFLYAFVDGIKSLIKIQQFNKDFKNKSSSTLNEKPYKMKIRFDKVGKYSSFFHVRYAKLYFKNIKLIIPLSYVTEDNSGLRRCYEECLKLEGTFTYLTKSKIIIKGSEKYIKIIKKTVVN